MTKRQHNLLFWLILALAAFLRLFKLGEVPSGINQDEAYTAYEALSLLTHGTDSWGNSFPLYFISWGSGSSILYSYLSIPFILLFGTETWIIRLPQALLGVLSCYVFYRLLRILFNRNQALLGFFLSAVIPWHIMLSRWGLDANIAPFFILTGLYFFLRSNKKPTYLLLSAIFYGFGLYAYAAAWIYITITFGLQLFYLLLLKRDAHTLYTTLSAGIIFLLFASPLVLFILINNGGIDEIKTPWFSIPKLIYYRQNEIGLNDFSIKLSALSRIFFKGDDYLITNQIPPYGIFYPISLPFILLGLWQLINKSLANITKQEFSPSAVILGSVIIGLFYAALLYPCINRLNFLWFNLLLALTIGINTFIRHKKIYFLILLLYIGYTSAFTYTYFRKYNTVANPVFTPDLKPALDLAEKHHQQTNLPIKILGFSAIHPKILFYKQISAPQFYKTVIWQHFPAPYLEPASFTHFHFFPDFDYTNLTTDSVYIVPIQNINYFYLFAIFRFGQYGVAIPKKNTLSNQKIVDNGENSNSSIAEQ